MDNYNEILKKLCKLPERVTKDNNYSRASYWKENWNKDYYLKYAIETGKPYQKIVAKFLQLKNTPIDNYEQVNFFFQRNQAVASQMTGFSLDKIERVYKFLETKMSSFRIALETIGKYLEENIDQLENTDKEAIIILSNGEKVYDTKRLRELESEGKVIWRRDKWWEVNN
jgi:hypothetical protein